MNVIGIETAEDITTRLEDDTAGQEALLIEVTGIKGVQVCPFFNR